jgi:hypothetical protein
MDPLRPGKTRQTRRKNLSARINVDPVTTTSSYKPPLQAALLTVLTLVGGLLVGVVIGLVFQNLRGHSLPSALNILLGVIPAITGLLAGAAARGLAKGCIARSKKPLLWRVGLATTVATLVVNLAMEASGWVVGAPGAAEWATLLVVMFVGNLGAVLAGGAVLGWTLTAAVGSG